MPPFTQSIGLEEDDPRARFQSILQGGGRQRELTTATAFEQFFDPTLSGEQESAAQAAVKGRIARGLRGAAAEQAGADVRAQFQAANRLAALGGLQQIFQGQSGLPIGRREGLADPFLALPGTGVTPEAAAGRAPGLATLFGELGAFRTLGADPNVGFGGINALVEGAEQFAGGDRSRAFGSLFESFQDPTVQDVLNPGAALGRFEQERRGILEEQVTALQQNVFPDPSRAPGQNQGLLTSNRLEITPTLIRRLGLPDPTEFGSQNAFLQAPQVREALAQEFGLGDLPSGTEFRASVQQGPRGLRSVVDVFANDLTSRANLLLNLENIGPTGGINRSLAGRFKREQRNIGASLEAIKQLQAQQESIFSPLEQISGLEGLSPEEAAQAAQIRTSLFQPSQPFGLS